MVQVRGGQDTSPDPEVDPFEKVSNRLVPAGLAALIRPAGTLCRALSFAIKRFTDAHRVNLDLEKSRL